MSSAASHCMMASSTSPTRETSTHVCFQLQHESESCFALLGYTVYICLHRVSKNVPPLARYNFDTHEWILILCGRNVTNKVGNQKSLYIFSHFAYFLISACMWSSHYGLDRYRYWLVSVCVLFTGTSYTYMHLVTPWKLVILSFALLGYTVYICLHRVSKNVPPLAWYNFDTHEWILIFLAEMLPVK